MRNSRAYVARSEFEYTARVVIASQLDAENVRTSNTNQARPGPHKITRPDERLQENANWI